MGRAALARGYDYIAICDHTPAVGAVRGLTPDDVRRQADEIAAANAVLAPFRVLRGIECDILPDGRLDLPDDVLAGLDWVQASVHGGQRMPRRELTARVEAALRNPAVRCLSHPTGRLINRRPENAVDLERVIEVALEEGIALEVNGLPDRLDLRPELVRDALEAGVRIVCSTRRHGERRAHGAARLGDAGRRGQHAAAGGDPRRTSRRHGSSGDLFDLSPSNSPLDLWRGCVPCHRRRSRGTLAVLPGLGPTRERCPVDTS
jgi:DNA polymerase (family 10)